MGIDTERQIEKNTSCAIDPGREKFGIAVGGARTLVCSAVLPREKLDAIVRGLKNGEINLPEFWRVEGREGSARVSTVYLGDGTAHEEYAAKLTEGNVRFILADERKTTLEARQIYWDMHPPTGLARFLPRSLLVPPRAIDDLAAWAILKRAEKITT